MTFFLYRLIQETYPSAWIQLPCAYRWLLLAASLSPDLPTHQLQRLITKNISIDIAHYRSHPLNFSTFTITRISQAKSRPSSPDIYVSCLSKDEPTVQLLSFSSAFDTSQEPTHYVQYSVIPALQQVEGEEDSGEASSETALTCDGEGMAPECFLVVEGGWTPTAWI